MKRIIALALTLAILLVSLAGCVIFGHFTNTDLPTYRDNYSDELKPPPSMGTMSGAMIDSLDKLNYYGAMRILAATPMPIAEACAFIPLYTEGEDVEEPTDPDISDGESTPSDTVDDQTKPDPDKDVYYYRIDPDEPFNFNKVSMFQIELTDEGGFLAQTLGLGVVDVVISENCIWGDSLITFRNGESFFSCLLNGGSYDRQTGLSLWEFSTHKYVDGFYIVKNLEQENYAFRVSVQAEGTVVAFECAMSENGGDRVDENVEVVSSTVISTDGGSFSAEELEAYFKKEDINEQPTPDNNA